MNPIQSLSQNTNPAQKISSSNQQEMEERKFNFGGDYCSSNKILKFPSNFIKTSKYNMITFLPKSIMMQFTKYANWYFLFAAILQSFPIISTQTPVSAIAPLVFVILLSMLREGIEDMKRHKSDKEMNGSSCIIYQKDNWEQMKWANVQVGDLILVKEDEIIAADAVIICSSQETGQAYIETSSLDGEKNLKPRQSLSDIQTFLFSKMANKLPINISGVTTCCLPNPQLGLFEGCLYINLNNEAETSSQGEDNNSENKKKLPINIKNLLLRGSRIKNLAWAIGIVVYTGKDTKIMRNADQGRNKLSGIDKKCNEYIIYVLVVQLLLCISISLLNLFSCKKQSNLTPYIESDCVSQVFITAASYLLLLNTMIPISLIVSLEFIKVGQAHYMEKDKELYSMFNKKPLSVNCVQKVFSCTINEELGQIQHVFSDKTGTLTCNKMEFKMLICGKITYGDYNRIEEITPHGFERDQETAQIANRKRMPSYVNKSSGVEYCFVDPTLEKLINEKDSDSSPLFQNLIQFKNSQGQILYELKNQKEIAKELLLLLSTCHECVLQESKSDGNSYQGPSPDEIALVDSASRVGYAFKGIDKKEMIITVKKEEKRVQLLHSFEFDSDRKRMSVIILDDNIIKMYVKGADSIIKARLNKQIEQPYLKNIDQSLEEFSCKGLRTLCLAMKVLSKEEYEVINNKISSTIGKPNQEKEIKLIAEQIEVDLILLGATAVEDRLQDNVPEVLRDFLKANINVWMLTGDKLETAENIGRSCNLITSKMGVIYIRGINTSKGIDELIQKHIQDIPTIKQNYFAGIALVVEGDSLSWILGDEERKNRFLQIIIQTKSVICCRVTPKQKAEVVKLVKEKLKKVTLAIGDGANDVNMIQEAHIGIGIYGNEGMRAVQASDYAIGQFQFLWKLVLYHGRLNYIRISECILYFFYKNFVFTFPQFFFAFFCLYSGQSIFDDWYITFYNCVFTFWRNISFHFQYFILFNFTAVVIKSVYEEDIYYRKKKNLDGGEVGKEEKVIMSKIGNEDNDIIQKFYPKLYYIGQANRIFQFSRFCKWTFLGILQGAFCFFLHVFCFNQGVIDQTGHTTDIWIMSISLYTAIIIMWTIWNWIAFIFTSLGLYFGYVWAYDNWKGSVAYLTVSTLVRSSKFYFTVTLTVLTCFTIDFLLLTGKNQKESLLNYFKKTSRRQKDIELERVEQLQDKLERELIDRSHSKKTQGSMSIDTNPSPFTSVGSDSSSDATSIHDIQHNYIQYYQEIKGQKNGILQPIIEETNESNRNSKNSFSENSIGIEKSTEQGFLQNQHL